MKWIKLIAFLFINFFYAFDISLIFFISKISNRNSTLLVFGNINFLFIYIFNIYNKNHSINIFNNKIIIKSIHNIGLLFSFLCSTSPIIKSSSTFWYLKGFLKFLL